MRNETRHNCQVPTNLKLALWITIERKVLLILSLICIIRNLDELTSIATIVVMLAPFL